MNTWLETQSIFMTDNKVPVNDFQTEILKFFECEGNSWRIPYHLKVSKLKNEKEVYYFLSIEFLKGKYLGEPEGFGIKVFAQENSSQAQAIEEIWQGNQFEQFLPFAFSTLAIDKLMSILYHLYQLGFEEGKTEVQSGIISALGLNR